jgi:hypothetical protein
MARPLTIISGSLQVPKLKPGSGPRTRLYSGSTVGAEDSEDALLLEPDQVSPYALGALAARLSDQAQGDAGSPQLEQWGEQEGARGDSAMASESAPGLATLGRRLAPGPAPGLGGGPLLRLTIKARHGLKVPK